MPRTLSGKPGLCWKCDDKIGIFISVIEKLLEYAKDDMDDIWARNDIITIHESCNWCGKSYYDTTDF